MSHLLLKIRKSALMLLLVLGLDVEQALAGDDLDELLDYLVAEQEFASLDGTNEIISNINLRTRLKRVEDLAVDSGYLIQPKGGVHRLVNDKVFKKDGFTETLFIAYPNAEGSLTFFLRLLAAGDDSGGNLTGASKMPLEVRALGRTYRKSSFTHSLVIQGYPGAYVEVKENKAEGIIVELAKGKLLSVRPAEPIETKVLEKFVNSLTLSSF